MKPIISEFTINDSVNGPIRISIDRDADPGVLSFVMDQQDASDYFYATLDGLKALVAAAEQMEANK